MTDILATAADIASVVSEGSLALVLAHAGVGLGIVDRDLRFLCLNEQLAEMNGVSVAGHIGKTLREVLPLLADDLEPLLQDVLRSGQAVIDINIEGETAAYPGVLRTWKASYHPNRSADGAITGVLFVIREVTEEARVARALAGSEARLQMALDGTAMGVWDWSVDTDYVWFSDTWQTMLGYQPGEVAQHISSWQDAVHPDDWPVINAALAPHLAGEIPHYECEHRVRCKDGSWLWILDRGEVVERSEDGRPVRMVGTHDNIQQRKEAEFQRAALLELGRDLAEMNNADRIIDRAMTALHAVLDVDFAAYIETGEGPDFPRMVRRWRDGSVGRSPGLWRGGRLHTEINRRMQLGETVQWPDLRLEEFMDGADVGDEAHGRDIVALIGVPILRQDRLVGTMLAGHRTSRAWSDRNMEFLSDVRDRTREAIARARAGEANRRAQEELLRIGRLNALAALASTLAHELNQPLAAASNYLTAARLKLRHPPEPGLVDDQMTADEIVELAARQVVHAGEIIRRMRAYTSSGEVVARMTSVSRAIDSAIDATLVSMAPRIIAVRRSYGQDLPELMLDEVQFQQVICNLVRNAIEAMDGVEQPELGVAIACDGDRVVIDVTDNGSGLTPEVQATLFQPFRSEKPRGLGLGLAICRTIIEAHGGRLTARPRAKGGAHFRIDLPLSAHR